MTAWASVAEMLGDDLDDIELLGRGSSGAVYRARQLSLERTVAVKVFRRFAGDQSDRVIAEARAQAALSWHANVVSLYAQGVTPDGFPYLVMEYAPGGSLKDRVRDAGPLDEPQCRRLGAELASALEAAHRAGVVHCDVKPSNVLFAADGSVRLADFGIARATGMTSGTLDSIEGSLAYVPPELLEGQRPSPANDIYSLALTLSFARSGRPPFSEDLSLAQMVAAVQTGTPDVEPDTGDGDAPAVLERALSRDPEKRPSTERMSEVLGGSGPGAPPPTKVDAGGGRGRIWYGVAILVLMAVIGVLLARQSEPEVAAVPEPEPAFDLCAEYQDYVDARSAVLVGAAERLEQSRTPVDAAQSLVHDYPNEFGRVAAPFIHRVIAESEVTGEVTEDQLALMGMADNVRVLGGGKPFLFDGAMGSFDAAVLPTYLVQPAQVFSEVNRYASERCPDVVVDFEPLRARLSSALFSNLSDPVFMERFFSDPRSLDVFDSRATVLVATYAWTFFEQILLREVDWFEEVLTKHDDIRRVLSMERPETILRLAQLSPSVLQSLGSEEWKTELQYGLDRATPATRLGIATTFPSELQALGLSVQ